MLAGLWNILFFCIAIGVVVIVHEAGHYFVARWCKVKIYRFAIGFGPVIYRKVLKDGSDFVIAAIPLGGYVKMKGEANDGLTPSEQSLEKAQAQALSQDAATTAPAQAAFDVNSGELASSSPDTNVKLQELDSFASKSPLQRALIVVAGPLCNILLALILYYITNLVPTWVMRPIVGAVYPDSPAAMAQLQSDDLILSIEGEKIESWSKALEKFLVHAGHKVEIEYASDLGVGEHHKEVLDLTSIDLDPQKDLLTSVGLYRSFGATDNIIDGVAENSLASALGIQKGDRLLEINDTKVRDFYDVLTATLNIPLNSTLKLTFEREGQVEVKEVKLSDYPKDMLVRAEAQREHLTLGISYQAQMDTRYYKEVHIGPLGALPAAVFDTWHMGTLIVTSLKKMIVGEISVKNIAGPISLAKGAGATAASGLFYFISFVAAFSVNLGVLNLVPIPILDGGQLVFIAYEAVTKRKPNERLSNLLTMIGLSVVLLVTFLAIFNDLAFL